VSLINQMLRDLEARRGGLVQAHDTVLEGLSSAAVWTGPAARPLPLVVLAATGVIAAILLLAPLPGEPPVTPLRQPAHPPAVAAAIPAAAPASALAGTTAGASTVAGTGAAQVSGGLESAQITTELRALAATLGVAPHATAVTGSISAAPSHMHASATPPVARLEAKIIATEAPTARSVPDTQPADVEAKADSPDAHAGHAGAEVERPGSFRRAQAVLVAPTAGNVELARALNLLASGQSRRGLDALRAYVLGHPRERRVRARFARELLKAGRATEAEAVLRTGLKLTPDAAELARLLAHRLFDDGDPAQALHVLLRAAPPVAADPEYHAFVAALHQQAEDHAAAAATYRAILAVRSDSGAAWLGLGISLAAGSKPDEARAAFARAVGDVRLSSAIREFARQETARLERSR
jgi:Flp pilus assembly protein TadD